MNPVQKYDKVQFNIPIAESLLYHPWLEVITNVYNDVQSEVLGQPYTAN